MSKCPLFNDIKKKDAFRSSLGIEETINTMQSDLCQAIGNNTSYAYYYAFITWAFYDYELNTDKVDYSFNGAYEYLKKQNFFFSLSYILNDPTVVGAIGYDYINRMDLNANSFSYQEQYLQSLQSLEYYYASLDTLLLLKNDSLDGDKLSHPTITEYGKELAVEFEKVISNTDYYKKYRLSGVNIPREVLIQLANTVDLHLTKNKELKECLKNIFFDNKYVDLENGLRSTKDYVLFIDSKYDISYLKNNMRNVIYDYFSPRGYNYDYPEELKDVVKKWELVCGRRYFTLGISIIWKYMLPIISEPLSFNEWVEKCLNYYEYDFDFNEKLSDYIDRIDLSYEKREEIINRDRKDGFEDKESICNGIKLILSVYKRFIDRDDINPNISYIVNSDSDTLPLYAFFDIVNKYLDEPIYKFIEYLMMNYLIKQNERTAYRKMMNENKYGYHYEEFNNKYVLSRHYYFGLGNDRIIALIRILKDLNMLVGDVNE